MLNATAVAPARATMAPARAYAARAPAATAPAPSQSPTLIVLTLRPNGEQFTGNRIVCAQEAGFGWLKSVHALGWQSPDTGREIARFVVNGYDEAVGELKEIQLHIDPANCAVQWRAGTRLIHMLTAYSGLINAHLADGVGNPLDNESLTAVAHHIDAVMEQREEVEEATRTVVLPNGEKRISSPDLSFAYTVTREAGSKRKTYRPVFFNAEPMDYYQGRAAGMQMAGEMIACFRAHQNPASITVTSIIREALERCESDHGVMGKAQISNVVSGFMEVIEALVVAGSRELNPKWLSSRIACNLDLQRQFSELQATQKSAMVERLRKGREAAKARRLAQGRVGAA